MVAIAAMHEPCVGCMWLRAAVHGQWAAAHGTWAKLGTVLLLAIEEVNSALGILLGETEGWIYSLS
jgi:hypothetical protein